MFLQALDLQAAFVCDALDSSTQLCPCGWTAGPLPRSHPAASASFALLFVFPLEPGWVNSNALAWLQFPANFH